MPSDLYKGDKGDEVRELQSQITMAGYGEYMEPYGIDGDFGSLTQKAVALVQRDAGIEEAVGYGDPGVGSKVKFLGGGFTHPQTKKCRSRKRSFCCELTIISNEAWSIHPWHIVSTDGGKVYGWGR